MKKLGIIIAMTVAVVAYKDGRRGTLSPLEDFPPYQGVRQHPLFHEQHQPFREQSFKTQYQSYRQRPYRQDPYPERLSFKDHSLLKDYSPTKSRSFYTDRSFFRDVPDSKGQASFFIDGGSFKDQQFREPTSVFKNEQALQQSFGDDFRFSDSYDKQITSYKNQDSGRELSFRDSEYLKHGNHGLGYVSVPPISPYENVLPFDGETSTTTAASMTPPTTHKPLQQSTVSNVASAITQLHTSATSQPKMALHTVTMPSVKSDTLANSVATSQSASTVSAIPTASVASKQSSNVAHPPTALPTMASLPAITTESPIVSLERHTFPRIDFPAKFTAPASYYVSSNQKNKLQQSLLGYLLSQQAKNTIKNNEQSSLLNYALPDASYNDLNNKIPSSLSGYVLPVESKDALKDSLRSSLLSYLLQPESGRGLSFQQSSLPETMNYVPLADTFAERAKLPIPSIPIATLSAVSRPLQAINYVATLPRVPSFVTQDSSSALPLASGTTLTSGLAPSFQEAQSTSVFNGGLNGGISASIPGSLSTAIPAGIPTLNLGQNFQHFGQLRPFEATRSQPLSYSTGMQLQLGGFGGIDYALRSSNPAPWPLELGVAKVGLSLPELPRHQLFTIHQRWV